MSRPRPGLPRTMGSILSRRIAGVEDIDIQANSAYRYPPKSGERPARPRARSRRGLGWNAGWAGRARAVRSEEGAVGSARPAALPEPPSPELRATSTQTVGGVPGCPPRPGGVTLGQSLRPCAPQLPCVHAGETH